jgi:hypothetical protein
MGNSLEDAGILKVGGEELTDFAKTRFILDVKELLKVGSSAFPSLISCGPAIPPLPVGMEVPELENEELYPDFHANAVTNYEIIAKMLNMPGQTPFMPIIFDPLHVGAKLGIDVPPISLGEYPSLMLNLPAMLLKLEVGPIDIPSFLPKLLGLITPPVPPIPTPPPLPEIDIPGISINPIELFADLPTLTIDPILNIPNLFTGLIGQFPMLAIDLLTLNLEPICDLALNIFMVPKGPNPLLEVAVAQVTAIKTTEMLALNLVAMSLGSASGGAVGAIGAEFGYTPPPQEPTGNSEPKSVRDKIIDFANKMDGKSYGNESTRNDYALGIFPRFIYKNDGDPSYGNLADTDNGKKGEPGTLKPTALIYARTASSCGLFVRSALINAGASGDPYFDEQYVPGTAISGLLRIARKKGALLFDKSKGDKSIPSFKAGDVVIVGSITNDPYPLHVELFLSNYDGGYGGGISGIGGGAIDENNPDPSKQGKFYGTAIKKVTYKFQEKSDNNLYKYPFAGPENEQNIDASRGGLRPVLAIIDMEKMLNSD